MVRADPEGRQGMSTTLYVLEDMHGAVIYVGISNSPWHRFDAHRTREWWNNVATIKLTHYAHRADAATAEKSLIATLRPPGNVASIPTAPVPPPSVAPSPFPRVQRPPLPVPCAAPDPFWDDDTPITLDDPVPEVVR
jgi:predicted GIY-YIG superfamily endonuclease